MKEPLLQGNWKIEIQVSFTFDTICFFFLFSTVSKCVRVCLEGLADSAVEKH